MGLLLDLLQAAAGEASLHSRLGRWRQAVSGAIESVQGSIAALQGQLSSIRTAIGVSDEGVSIGDFTDLDFIGAGVQVFPGPNETAVVFIPSGGGGFPGYGGAPPNVSTASSAGVSLLVSRSDHTHGHGDLPGGTLHAVATAAVAGFMSATDKAALDALVAGGPFVPTTRTLTAGAGLTGGGDLSADRAFDIVAADTSIVVNADSIQVNPTIQSGAALGATSVQPSRTLFAGAGMTGGGDLSANRTFDVVAADTTIIVNADSIQVGTVPVGQVSGAVPATRTLTAGAGMTGGGDLSADRTFDVGANADGSIVVNANDIQVSAAIQSGAALGATSVQPARTLTAGAGLTGGGDLSADRTFDVGANADGSIVVNANDIQVNPTLQSKINASSSIGLSYAMHENVYMP